MTMIPDSDKKKEIKYICIVFFVCLIPRILLACAAIPLRTPSDEFSTMFFGSYLGGNDWTKVESFANYYGFGMSLFTWWIYKLPISIVYKYKLLLCFCGILQSFAGVIAYAFARQFDEFKKSIQIIISIAASYMVVTRNTVFYNEHALIMISWLLAFLFVKLIQTLMEGQKKAGIYLGCLLIVYGMSFIIHTRAITYVVAACITLLLFLILERKISVRIIVFLFLTGVLYLAVKKIGISSYILRFFSDAHRDLTNSQISVPHFSMESLLGTLLVGVGQSGTILMSSMGILLIGAVYTIAPLLKCINKRTEKNLSPFVYGQIYMMICIVMTIMYQGLTWRGGEYITLWLKGDTGIYYAYKVFTYIRYIGPYLGPLFLAGLVNILKEHSKRWSMCIFGVYSVVILLWIKLIYPFVVQNGDCSEAFICWAFNEAFAVGKKQYVFGFLISTVMLILSLYCSVKKKQYAVLLLLIVILGYQYCYNAIVYDIKEETVQFEKVDGTVKVVSELNTNGIEIGDTIYAIDTTPILDHQFFYTLQVYLEKYRIEPELDDSIPFESLIITNDLESFRREFNLEEFNEYYIDDNEALLTRNNRVIDFLDDSDLVSKA